MCSTRIHGKYTDLDGEFGGGWQQHAAFQGPAGLHIPSVSSLEQPGVVKPLGAVWAVTPADFVTITSPVSRARHTCDLDHDPDAPSRAVVWSKTTIWLTANFVQYHQTGLQYHQPGCRCRQCDAQLGSCCSTSTSGMYIIDMSSATVAPLIETWVSELVSKYQKPSNLNGNLYQDGSHSDVSQVQLRWPNCLRPSKLTMLECGKFTFSTHSAVVMLS